jgi:hypothetical protein
MATTATGLSDERAARLMVALRDGRTPKSFGVSAPRVEAYCATHPAYAVEALPLLAANMAAMEQQKLVRLARIRQRSADNRREAERCAKGHVRTLENTYYVLNERNNLVRRCKDCNKQARDARMPTLEQVRGAVAALHHGQVLSSIAKSYSQKSLRNFMLKNPKIAGRMWDLSKRNAATRRGEFKRSRRLVAVSALMKNDGFDAYEIVRKATAHLHEDERGDVMSRLFVAIAEGLLKLSDVPSRVGEFVKAQRHRPRALGDPRYSLDNPIGDDSGLTWLDTKTDADRLWA